MNIPPAIKSFALSRYSSLAAYILIAIVASVQALTIGFYPGDDGFLYTDFNNYIIFRQSFFHLIEGRPLYIWFPGEHYDLFKYSPAFALFFGALAWLPDYIGLPVWNILNGLVFWIAIRQLPLSAKQQNLILWFCLIELLTSMQSVQSNGLLAGLMILSLAHMEKRKVLLATLWIVLATFIKVYGAAAFIIFFFYPQKPKFIFYSALWSGIFFFIPLVVLSFPDLMAQYRGWISMMSHDQAISYGISVMGWLQTWFGLANIKNYIMVVGVVLFFLPLAFVKAYNIQRFRLLFLAHVLIWIIIFNHKAESPTFIIAMAGVGIWYMVAPTAVWRTIILWFTFIGTGLSHTDLFPAPVREQLIYPYVIKVFPCIIAWIAVMSDLLIINRKESEYLRNSPARAQNF
jgi:hypothetical protein